MSGYEDIDASALGPNMWLIDEMYRRFREDPDSVDEKWREFFDDFRPRIGEPIATSPPAEIVGERAGKSTEPAVETSRKSPDGPVAAKAAEKAAPAKALPPGAERIRFGAERIAKNMEASLEIPTATSFRFIPAKLLEENRRVVNRFLASGRGGKVSFTHVIGYAIVRAVDEVPAMKRAFAQGPDGLYVVTNETVNLGLAVDVAKDDGVRSLLVPNIKGANHMDFARFWASYEDIIRRVRANKLTP